MREQTHWEGCHEVHAECYPPIEDVRLVHLPNAWCDGGPSCPGWNYPFENDGSEDGA